VQPGRERIGKSDTLAEKPGASAPPRPGDALFEPEDDAQRDKHVLSRERETLSAASHELLKQCHAEDLITEPDEPIDHAELVAQLYRPGPEVDLDQDGNIRRRAPKPTISEGAAFLYFNWR
jgi:hypothetical protein